jgi:hypothetical protein
MIFTVQRWDENPKRSRKRLPFLNYRVGEERADTRCGLSKGLGRTGSDVRSGYTTPLLESRSAASNFFPNFFCRHS